MSEADYHINLSQFDYDVKERLLTAEASELGVTPGRPMPLYFTVNSEKTNRKITFAHMFTQSDTEGDVMYWTYTVDTRFEQGDDVKDLKVRIYND